MALTIKAFAHKYGSYTNYGITICGEGYDIFCDKDSKHYGKWCDFGTTDISGGYSSYAEARTKAAEMRKEYKAYVQAQDADGIIRNPNFGKFIMSNIKHNNKMEDK